MIEKTAYGIKIDRKSHVTIIAPTAGTECSIGHFSYYMDQFGGFNFVSREFVKDVDDPVSFYTISDDSQHDVREFMEDIKTLSSSQAHWNIAMISSDNMYDTQIHVVYKVKQGDRASVSVLSEERFHALSDVMKEQYELLCDIDEKYRPVGPRNIKTGAGVKNNGFTLRISYSVTTWMDSSALVAFDLSKIIRLHLEAEKKREFTEHPGWKLQGNGFGVNNDENKQ